MAYVLRKANPNLTVSGQVKLKTDIYPSGEPDDNSLKRLEVYPSNEIDSYPSKELSFNKNEPSIDTYPSTEKTIAVNTGNLNVNKESFIDGKMASVQNEPEKKKKEYIPYQSSFITELSERLNERDYLLRLQSLFRQNEISSKWISERYKCLLECLLLISEMKETETDDLKEVCNALTGIIQSKYFKSLQAQYPYTSDIKELRNGIKNICLNAGEDEWIRYRPNRKQKQNMIVTRFELSQFIPKRSFSELNFNE